MRGSVVKGGSGCYGDTFAHTRSASPGQGILLRRTCRYHLHLVAEKE
ncbi:MAG: hypothetical protein PHI97_06325 [Desulfobulbus sp.]|nr:hypothetical protein [Desulfobulbus sp.]